jgi:tetratricopeptide (TPR) repeat protein
VRRSLLGILAVAGLALGCNSRPATVSTGSAPVSSPATREEAAALAARGDYATAAERYRELVQRHPDDVLLHYAYGSVLSHLDRRQDAIAEFTWVVANGRPSLAEVVSARQWLLEAGALVSDSGKPVDSSAPARPTAAAPSTPPPSGAALPSPLLRGQTSWPGVNPEVRRVKLEIRLVGEDDGNRSVNLPIRIDLGKPYKAAGVPPGAYHLIGQSGKVQLWDKHLVLEPGKETVLDLGPESSSVSPGEFPPPPTS